jgi:pyridoxine 4-dehydrogenase
MCPINAPGGIPGRAWSEAAPYCQLLVSLLVITLSCAVPDRQRSWLCLRHAGLSEVSVEQIEAARRHFPVATVQNQYNLVDRTHEAVLEYCEKEGIGFIPYFPLAAGSLARPGTPLDAIARSHGATPSQIALAWMLKRSAVMLPIPSTSKVAHLEENVAAAGIRLSDQEFATLDQIGRGRRV